MSGAYEQGFAKGVKYACTELKLLSRRRHLPLAIMLMAAYEMGLYAQQGPQK
jgi:hypothetical protein